ncbi:ATP-binding protein [uncultured Pontibacter sp.]|uniref:ATP-binding protein n=1 Tax=uncultured Pontibacter sp. TaxID=453356 RepID=UPI00261A5C4B|nr:ATP-binding protein [uncultured Pontibacter sp.]
MKQKVTPLILFFLAVLSFLAATALHFNFPRVGAQPAIQEQLAAVSARTQQNILKAKAEAEGVAQHLLNDDISFTNLLQEAVYPTFIYKNNQLVFWSDHTLVPDLDITNTIKQVTTVRSKYGVFIVVPHNVNSYDVYVCVPLQVNESSKVLALKYTQDNNILEGIKATLELDAGKKMPAVYSADKKYLFGLDFVRENKQNQNEGLKLFLLLAGSVLFILASFALALNYIAADKHNRGVVSFLLLLISFRFLLLVLELPFSIAEIGLFDPKLYAASFWSPSVGDLALNMLLLVTVAGAGLYLFKRNRVIAQLHALTQKQVKQYLIVAILIFYLLLVVLYRFYHGLYHNSPLVLDITQSLSFTKYKLIIYGVMVIHTIAIALFTYIISSAVLVLLQRVSKLWPYKVLLLVTAVLFTLTAVFQLQFYAAILAGTFFWVIVAIAAQNSKAISLPYKTYLFFFLVIMVSAIVGAFALFNHYQEEVKVYKQKFATNLLQDNDVLGEYLLEEVSFKIAKDAFIRSKMMGPYIDAGFIKRKISKQYLQEYFNKYETNVLLFDSEGRTLESADTTAATLQELLLKYNTPQTRTERPNLFLVKDPSRYNARTYFKVINIPISQYLKGTIVLQLTLKRLLPHSLVPELLKDQHHSQPFRMDMLSYAIYEGMTLSYSEGEYDYATNFNPEHIGHTQFYNDGHNQGNYHHLGVKDDRGHTLVITTEKYGLTEILSNFSFLFLTYTASLILLGFLFLVIQRRRIREFSPNFSTKIQIFLNFGILLPLLLVSVTTAGLVTASYKKDLMTTYEQRGESIQENLSQVLNNRLLSRNRALGNKINEIAALSEADINLYDRNGKLIVTSQPFIFEAGLLSDLVNPKAFAAISEKQALRVLLEEQAGDMTFNAVYLPLRSEANPNDLLGFIGIPFFDSEKELDLKLIELITTTMNIFTVMFIMFMMLTFFASRALTVPLRMLAEKLKRTSLTGKNEMLAYEGADEIGMLVNEYNRMLLTLEQNKEELAMQEKEAAWREMARQVAHEIKNPLTPMKLSLQYLQKAIAEKKPNTEQLIDKISHTLITQINILSDIATSFSSFTSMPEPKQERIDVAATLRKSADLHKDPATAIVETKVGQKEVIVVADESLMVRTFNNLLLNAIQAVPTTRKPHIKITLEEQADSKVLISIRDNGNGIPEDIRGKVFIPNFSTKYTGSGIGLAVAKRGIENAGGQIWFETEEGRGTTFYISLPLAEV